MATMRTLKTRARKASNTHDHDLGAWQEEMTLMDGGTTAAVAECRRCHEFAEVWGGANEDIFGNAVSDWCVA